MSNRVSQPLLSLLVNLPTVGESLRPLCCSALSASPSCFFRSHVQLLIGDVEEREREREGGGGGE